MKDKIIMENKYKLALAEVYEILLHLPKTLQIKIPQKLFEFIEKERDLNYKVKIKLPLSINDYSQEAIVLIGMIYKDYLCI